MGARRHAAAGEAVAGAGPVWRRSPRRGAACSLVGALWSTTVPADATSCRILPDGHLDVVWDGRSLHVAGPDSTARRQQLPPGAVVVGLQVAPGAARAVLGAPASAVRDDRVDLAELWAPGRAEALADALRAAAGPAAAADAMEAAVARPAEAAAVDPLAAEVRRRLGAGAPLAALADLGVGERQLRRRCTEAFGYGPKVLARVLRFQAFVDHLRRHTGVPLAAAAADAGYADQAHLGHEVVALAGLTPAALRAQLMSDPDKTGGR